METLLLGIYAFGMLAVIGWVLIFMTDVIKKKQKFSDRCCGPQWIAIVAFLTAFIPMYGLYLIISAPVPDGVYEVPAVYYFPGDSDLEFAGIAEIEVSSDVEYEDRESFAGGYEHTTTDSYFYQTVYLNKLYWSSQKREVANVYTEVEPDEYAEVYPDDMELYINIGPVNKERLGVSYEDIWEGQSAWGKYDEITAVLCCALTLYQYFKSKDPEDQ